MKIKELPIADLRVNDTNPRYIREDKLNDLTRSLKEAPWMLKLRPIVVDETNTILGGNMRYQAAKQAGMEKLPVVQAKDLTEAQKQEFLIKDNVNFGEWDWDILANEWEPTNLNDWGLDVWDATESFQPNFDPEQGNNFMSEDDMEKAKAKLNSGLSKGGDEGLKDVTCPHCGEEFSIER